MATDYVLTWDNGMGRVLSNGLRFMTDDKFQLSFEFDALYYEPEVGNAFAVLNGQRRQLSEGEILECRDFCEFYSEEHEYPVQAYDPATGLFLGQMLKSIAEASGFEYRVNEIPEFAASRWTGETWKRCALIVLENGTPIYDPPAVPAHAVFGLTEEEAKDIPPRPNMYHTWNFSAARSGGEVWVDARSLEKAKQDALASIRADFEFLRFAVSSYRVYIPSYETETWAWQIAEASAWLADNSAETPYIDAFLAARTDEGKPGKAELCADIMGHHAQLKQALAGVNGVQWGYLARVKAAQDNNACVAVMDEAKAYCMAERAKYEVA